MAPKGTGGEFDFHYEGERVASERRNSSFEQERGFGECALLRFVVLRLKRDCSLRHGQAVRCSLVHRGRLGPAATKRPSGFALSDRARETASLRSRVFPATRAPIMPARLRAEFGKPRMVGIAGNPSSTRSRLRP